MRPIIRCTQYEKLESLQMDWRRVVINGLHTSKFITLVAISYETRKIYLPNITPEWRKTWPTNFLTWIFSLSQCFICVGQWRAVASHLFHVGERRWLVVHLQRWLPRQSWITHCACQWHHKLENVSLKLKWISLAFVSSTVFPQNVNSLPRTLGGLRRNLESLALYY